ncbi:MAG: hypothetical protein F4Z31_12715 [Gemmatimonadetes bacterium]|nr:hypothetical protein [Gemmatimonadota bacterium]MYE95198.1 hypothetical protein [Gemmatimonadota bacterium]
MAVTVDAATVVAAAQVSEDQAARLLAVATTLVERYAPNAPEAIQNEAVIRVAGWLGQTPAGSFTRVQTGPRETEYAPGQKGALRHSGAMSLLAPWKVRRGGAI